MDFYRDWWLKLENPKKVYPPNFVFNPTTLSPREKITTPPKDITIPSQLIPPKVKIKMDAEEMSLSLEGVGIGAGTTLFILSIFGALIFFL